MKRRKGRSRAVNRAMSRHQIRLMSDRIFYAALVDLSAKVRDVATKYNNVSQGLAEVLRSGFDLLEHVIKINEAAPR